MECYKQERNAMNLLHGRPLKSTGLTSSCEVVIYWMSCGVLVQDMSDICSIMCQRS